MNATSPKSSLAKLGLYPRPKTLKVMVLGQSSVGKSAMVVRFITKRYIGEYDPTLEKIYTFHTMVDNEMVYFDILDTAGQPHENEGLALEANIRWAEAFILMYSVTDKCSFDECYRLKFLINYNKRRRRLGAPSKDGIGDVPVVLVGNKIDQVEDRMVTMEEGQRRSKEIGCVCFYEISVRESIEQVWLVFRDVYQFWRVHTKNPLRLRKPADPVSPEAARPACRPLALFTRRWTEGELEEEAEAGAAGGGRSAASTPTGEPAAFRERASTDGHLQQRPWRWRYAPPPAGGGSEYQEWHATGSGRRMSISMRGNNSSY